MGKGVNITVLGAPAIQKALQELDIKIQKKIVKKAIGSAMPVVLNKAQDLCLVDTGKLQASLHIAFYKRGGKAVGAYVMTGTREELGIEDDDPHFYPAAVEYGHGNVAARPFLRPALIGSEGRVMAILADEIARGAEEAFK